METPGGGGKEAFQAPFDLDGIGKQPLGPIAKLLGQWAYPLRQLERFYRHMGVRSEHGLDRLQASLHGVEEFVPVGTCQAVAPASTLVFSTDLAALRHAAARVATWEATSAALALSFSRLDLTNSE